MAAELLFSLPFFTSFSVMEIQTCPKKSYEKNVALGEGRRLPKFMYLSLITLHAQKLCGERRYFMS